MAASDNPPQPFNSSKSIRGASSFNSFNLGQIPRFSDRRPTLKKREKSPIFSAKENIYNIVTEKNLQVVSFHIPGKMMLSQDDHSHLKKPVRD